MKIDIIDNNSYNSKKTSKTLSEKLYKKIEILLIKYVSTLFQIS